MIATPQMSLEAAAEVARKAGITPLILANDIEGEARDVALVHAAIARQAHGFGQPSALLGPDSLARADKAGVSAKAMLANIDGYSFFFRDWRSGGYRANPPRG
jgi:glycerate-2-kinase